MIIKLYSSWMPNTLHEQYKSVVFAIQKISEQLVDIVDLTGEDCVLPHFWKASSNFFDD